MKVAFARTTALCITLVAATPAVGGDNARPAQKGSISSTTHINRTTDKPFDVVTAAVEKQLGNYDAAAVAAAMKENLGPSNIEAKIHAMEGTSGFMLFAVRDHGQLLSLKGKTTLARQYEIGNPLIALQMTQEDVRAGEYAPLRVYIYEGADHRTHIDYDLPSSVFGRFRSAGVDEVARDLDKKLDALFGNALRD